MKYIYKAGKYLYLLLITLLSVSFYKFIIWHIYTNYQRFLFLQKIAERYPHTIIPVDIRIPCPERVCIGEKSIISPGCYFNCGFAPYWGSIRLGTQVVVGYNSCIYAGGGKVSIGNNVDLGINCIISTQTRSLKQYPIQEAINFEHEFGEVVIGDGTLVASNVTILAGTTLGKYCNIVAGSVVQGTYPDNTTLAGNPARPFPRITFN